MEFPQTKIKKVLGDESQTKIKDFYFDAENECLVAADGFTLAVVDVYTYDDDESGTVPRCVADLTEYHECIQVRRDEIIAGDISIKTDDEFEYPDYQAVIKRTGANYKDMRPHFTINARRFWNLAQAICKPTSGMHYYVNVWIGDASEGDAIIVEPMQGGAIGVIMPVVRRNKRDGEVDPVDIAHRLRQEVDSDSDSVKIDGDLLRDLRKLYGVGDLANE